MAKNDPTTFATVIPSRGSPESVSSDADACRAGISRRQAMTALATVPVAAVVPISAASAFTVDRRKWDCAVHCLKAVEADYAQLCVAHSAAFDAAEQECPYRDEFFSRYGMGCYTEDRRERNFRAARIRIVNERVDAKGRYLTPEEAKQATADSYRVADDFEEWNEQRDAAHARHDCDQWEATFEAAVDGRHAAREAVLATPAPDQQALVFKVELLAGIMREAEVEDADRIALVSDDARRLLSAGRA